jgi:hypothetical protein
MYQNTWWLIRSGFLGPVNIGSDEWCRLIGSSIWSPQVAGKNVENRLVDDVDGPTGVRGRDSDNGHNPRQGDKVEVVSMDRNSWAGVVSPMNGSAGKSCGMRASKTVRFTRPDPLRSPRKLSAVGRLGHRGIARPRAFSLE